MRTTVDKKEGSSQKSDRRANDAKQSIPGSLSGQQRLSFTPALLEKCIGSKALHALLRAGAIQAKLRLGTSGDACEQEAERVPARISCESTGELSPSAEAREDEHLLSERSRQTLRSAAAEQVQCKKIEVGHPEMPTLEDLNFSIATLVGESSAAGPISEKTAIALVIKRRVESNWGDHDTFKDVILAQAYGNPKRNALAHLAELYLNENKTPEFGEFCELVDRSHKEKSLSKGDRDYLKSKAGFHSFVQRIEQAYQAMISVLYEEELAEPMPAVAREATWWGGEIDLWNGTSGKIWKHGQRAMNGELVFVVFQEIGKSYFLKEAKSIPDKKERDGQVERSRQFVCTEMLKKSGWGREAIIAKNPHAEKYLPAPKGKASPKASEPEISPLKWGAPVPSLTGPLSSVPDAGTGEVSSGIENGINALLGKGEPLDGSAREFFEPRFRTVFGDVRVHSGSEADHLNDSLQSRAFTVGGDIFFRAGEYSPGTARGRELLAHELTHVLQQKSAGMGKIRCAEAPSAEAAKTSSEESVSFVNPVPGFKAGRGISAQPKHDGVDIAMPEGTSVVAAADGTVVHAGDIRGYGLTVDIAHGGKFFTRHAHLSVLKVKDKDEVKQGVEVALSGNTGASTGPHLHFEIRQGGRWGKVLDPKTFITFTS